jgi:uncharacterized protein
MTPNGEQSDLGWVLDDFVLRVADVAHTIVVSADGILLARSSTLPEENADQLGAIASGLTSLSEAASRAFDAGSIRQACVEMEQGYLFTMAMSRNANLAVLATPDCELGLLAYEMSMLVEHVGDRLTPELRAERGLASRTSAHD